MQQGVGILTGGVQDAPCTQLAASIGLMPSSCTLATAAGTMPPSAFSCEDANRGGAFLLDGSQDDVSVGLRMRIRI